MNDFGGILKSACLLVQESVCVSAGAQNTSFCQSPGGDFNSHLMTALVFSFSGIFIFPWNFKFFKHIYFVVCCST